MAIHIGSVTLTNANTPLPLTNSRTTARQLFLQGNAAFSVGASTVTATTGIQCSAVGAVPAVNAPHTPCLGNTGGPHTIELSQTYVVSATPGAVINFLYIV